MTWTRKLTQARWSRPVWGVLALVTAVLLAVSFLLSGRAIRNAESEARMKAVDYTNTVLVSALTPEEVRAVILKADYRKLMIAVQGAILSDPAVARLRIWQPGGTLIFSSDQRDAIGQALGAGDPQIEAAVGGKVQSLITEARIAPKAGLAGSDERLYETFVPLRLGGAIEVSAVAQIDQRYSVIADEAYRFWRPAEWILGSACAVFLLLFWASLLVKPARAPAAGGAGEVPAQARAGTEELETRMRELQERLEARERELEETLRAKGTLERELEETLRAKETLEGELGEATASRALVGPAPAAEELSEELKRVTAERESMAGEVQRLTAALAAKEAELALAQESVAGGRAASEKADETVRVAEERARRAAEQAEGAERRAREAEVRARDAEARAEEAEAARVSLEAAMTEGKEAAEKSAAARVRQAEQEAEKARLQAAEMQARLAEERSKLSSLEASVKSAEERAATLDTRVRELEDERRRGVEEIARAEERLGNTQLELTRVAKRARELEERVRELEAGGALVTRGSAREAEFEGAATSPLARLRREAQRASRGPTERPAEEHAAEELAEGEEEPAPVDEAGLSLRERLARAAAARHRAPRGGEPES